MFGTKQPTSNGWLKITNMPGEKSIFCHCPVIWRMMIEVHNYDGGGDGADLEGIGDGIHLLHLGRVFCSDFWHTAARDGDCQIYQ